MEAASIFECKEPWFCMSVSFLDDRTLQVQVLGGREAFIRKRAEGWKGAHKYFTTKKGPA